MAARSQSPAPAVSRTSGDDGSRPGVAQVTTTDQGRNHHVGLVLLCCARGGTGDLINDLSSILEMSAVGRQMSKC